MAKNHQVYFSNHQRALRFPWSIYHRPLLDSLFHFLDSFPDPRGKRILVIGPGDFQELPYLLHRGFSVSVLDIDDRVLQGLRRDHGDKIDEYYLVDEALSGYPTEAFDGIYAKEVIEHLPDPVPFVQKLHGLLGPSGKLWLSTPNYEFFLLPLLENTVLEIVARLSGFSRKHIHPSKFGPRRIRQLLINADFMIETLEVTFASLALTVVAKPK